nr:E3 ubiquitin-protein ligase ORTHRUS 2-like [Tanacetum cinerariifolium]
MTNLNAASGPPKPYYSVLNQDIPDKAYTTERAKKTEKCFTGFLPSQLTIRTHDDEVGSSSHPKRTRVTKTIKEAILSRVYHNNMLWGICNQTLKSMYNNNLVRILPKQVYLLCIIDWSMLNTLGCGATIEETLEIKVMPDDELMKRKVIKFRICGRPHSFTILEFARRLGLYTSDEIQDARFETCFPGGLRNDDHFNANQYLLSISSKEELLVSRSLPKTKNKLWLMSMFEANVAWLIAKWMKRKEVGTQREYNMLRAIRDQDSKEAWRLIPEARPPQLGVLRDAMPRPPRPTINDLYDRIDRIEICQGELEMMSRRQSYHLDREAAGS